MALDNRSALPDWPDQIHQVFQDVGIRQVGYVPDAGHMRLIELCAADKNISAVALTTEEEGVAMLAGAWLGGERGVLLTQSSGVGNCVNMLSMIQECRFPFLAIVTMRGQWGEFNPWQVSMGQATRPALEAVGVKCFPVDKPAEISETFAAAADFAFNSRLSAAVLVSQRVIGAKWFGQK